jgi:putative oxidoreductase
MKFGILVLRLVVGGLFVGHGLQKLTGAFGGPGLSGTEKMMSSLELEPSVANARAAALTETIGGAALAVGFMTPIAGAGLIATMLTAVRKVHLPKGVWNSGGGYEYNAVLIAAVTAIAAEGPGLLSFDAISGKRHWGIVGGLFALGAGVAASTGLIEYSKRRAVAAKKGADAVIDEAAIDEAAAPAAAI